MTIASHLAPKIGVVTVTYNSASVLDDFLASLLPQSHANFLLYAVDNASRDDSVARLGASGDSRIIIIANQENLGVAEGNNIGIRRALADGCSYVLLLNNDTVFAAGLFATLLAELEDAESDMVTPKIFFAQPSSHVWFGGGYFRRGMGMMARMRGGLADQPLYNRRGLIEYAPTCCVLARRGVFDVVGEMDAAYFVYWDDTDFMLRAMRAGMSLLYAPSAVLYHKVSALTGGAESDFTLRYDTRNLVYYTRSHFRSWSAFWLTVHVFRLLARYLVRQDRWATFVRRLRAFREGLAMPLPPVRRTPK